MVFFHSPPLYMVDTPVVCLLYYSLILTGSFFFFYCQRNRNSLVDAAFSGHFGYIELPIPIFHPSHISELKRMLSLICLKCLKMKSNKVCR